MQDDMDSLKRQLSIINLASGKWCIYEQFINPSFFNPSKSNEELINEGYRYVGVVENPLAMIWVKD
jgi:hypothetical protein